MKKSFKLEELCCAHCAAKMEDGIKKLPGVDSASINFIAAKLTVEASEEIFSTLIPEMEKVIHRVEPDCELVR